MTLNKKIPMKKYFVILALFVCIQAKAQNGKLVWSDEFNEGSISKTNWIYDIGGNGWGNNELECYTNRPDNSKIEKGNLLIIGEERVLQWEKLYISKVEDRGIAKFHIREN